jgi:hypothetical protein
VCIELFRDDFIDNPFHTWLMVLIFENTGIFTSQCVNVRIRAFLCDFDNPTTYLQIAIRIGWILETQGDLWPS